MPLVTRLTNKGTYVILGELDEIALKPVASIPADTNLGFGSSTWSINSSFFGDPTIGVIFSGNGGITVDSGFLISGSGGWYTGGVTTTGNNFEIQAERTSYTGTNSGTTLGAFDLSTSNPTSWITIGTSGIILSKSSSGTATVVIRIREIAVPSNITTATFTLNAS